MADPLSTRHPSKVQERPLVIDFEKKQATESTNHQLMLPARSLDELIVVAFVLAPNATLSGIANGGRMDGWTNRSNKSIEVRSIGLILI